MQREPLFPWCARCRDQFGRDARFIVFEGIDGAGKSTQAQLLAQRIGRSASVLLTAEPSDGPVGQRIRSFTTRPDALEEARLFTEDRRHHVEHLIVPALNAGKVVICDRYVYSSVAYQGARGMPVAEILKWNAAFAVRPDVIVLLDLPVARALERISYGRDSASLFEGRGYLEKVAEIYRGLDDPLIVRIDALGEREAVQGRIVAALANLECFRGNFPSESESAELETE